MTDVIRNKRVIGDSKFKWHLDDQVPAAVTQLMHDLDLDLSLCCCYIVKCNMKHKCEESCSFSTEVTPVSAGKQEIDAP